MPDDLQSPSPPAPTRDDEAGVRMTIGEHLQDLRGRLIKSTAAFAVAFGVALFFQDRLMLWITWPLFKCVEGIKNPDGTPLTPRFIMGGPTAPFWAYMKLALIAGIVLASPIVAYQIWRFVSAGLYRRERRFVYTYAPFSLLLFLAGCAFGFFVLVRFGLRFLILYANPSFWDPFLNMENYMNLVMILTVMMGVLAQMPLVMMFVSRIGLVEPATFSKYRRHAIVANFVLAAVITPSGDIFTQCLMAAPLLALYEVGVILAKATGRRRAAEQAQTPEPVGSEIGKAAP